MEPKLITIKNTKQIPEGFHAFWAVSGEEQARRTLEHSGAEVGYYLPSKRYRASMGLLVLQEEKGIEDAKT